jgi:hypothetical protein
MAQSTERRRLARIASHASAARIGIERTAAYNVLATRNGRTILAHDSIASSIVFGLLDQALDL